MGADREHGGSELGPVTEAREISGGVAASDQLGTKFMRGHVDRIGRPAGAARRARAARIRGNKGVAHGQMRPACLNE